MVWVFADDLTIENDTIRFVGDNVGRLRSHGNITILNTDIDASATGANPGAGDGRSGGGGSGSSVVGITDVRAGGGRGAGGTVQLIGSVVNFGGRREIDTSGGTSPDARFNGLFSGEDGRFIL